MAEHQGAAELLRGETAQTLGFLLVQLTVLEQVTDLDALHRGLSELREAVRHELEHILQVASGMEHDR
jgi:hypothetical protein